MAINVINLISFVFLLSLLILPISNAVRNIPSNQTSSPFDFIKQLEGFRKGDNTKGIRNLKTYLKRFGYLENIPKTLTNNDYFDETLQSAIKTFQENYHINPTGTLDTDTISKLIAPRCGVPDIIKGVNHMQRHPNSNSSSIHTVSHFAFLPGKPTWPPSKRHLTYKLLGDFPEPAKLPVELAFKEWASVTRFTFSQDQNSEKTDITIGFFKGNHGDNDPFDGRGGVLAHAFQPNDGRMHFDLDELWFYIFKSNNAFDIKSVAIHEIGHLLGLAHSAVPEAIMWPTFAAGEVKDLHADDIQGIKTLYGF